MTTKIPLERKKITLAYMLFRSSLREASAGAQDGKDGDHGGRLLANLISGSHVDTLGIWCRLILLGIVLFFVDRDLS